MSEGSDQAGNINCRVFLETPRVKFDKLHGLAGLLQKALLANQHPNGLVPDAIDITLAPFQDKKSLRDRSCVQPCSDNVRKFIKMSKHLQ